MTAELLVLQFIDDGKLTVEDAVQLLETLKTEEDRINLSEKMMCVGVYTPTHIIFSVDLHEEF